MQDLHNFLPYLTSATSQISCVCKWSLKSPEPLPPALLKQGVGLVRLSKVMEYYQMSNDRQYYSTDHTQGNKFVCVARDLPH